MTIRDEIEADRDCGVIRCGVKSQHFLTISEPAHELGLREDPECYQEISKSAARRLLQLILHQDLAYDSEIMPSERAAQLADQFLSQFDSDARFFTNGNFTRMEGGVGTR